MQNAHKISLFEPVPFKGMFGGASLASAIIKRAKSNFRQLKLPFMSQRKAVVARSTPLEAVLWKATRPGGFQGNSADTAAWGRSVLTSEIRRAPL